MTHPVRLFFFLQKRAFQRLSAAGGRAALRADGRGRLPAACSIRISIPLALIQIEHLSFSYPSSYDPIFEDVSLRLDTSWKLGFIGRNGRGKTTFFKLLMGRYEYAGSIRAPVAFDYFPYPVPDPGRPTRAVLEGVCPGAESWQLERELSLLGVRPDALDRPFASLSNGEQTKVLLAALFLNEGHFLLIDEPTNHLDAKARAMVSAYLQKKQGFILVSHDRRFLDGCVDHILSLNRAGIEVQSGNFSSWFANFQQRQALEEAQDQRLRKDIKRLEQSARRTALWSDRVEASKKGAADKGYVGHKAAKMMKRAKTIEARQQKAIEEKSALLKNAETAEDLRVTPLLHYADPLVLFQDVEIRYGGQTVCGPLTFAVRQGERVALDGLYVYLFPACSSCSAARTSPTPARCAAPPGWWSRMSPRTPPALRGT